MIFVDCFIYTKENFYFLLGLVKPLIAKEDTVFRVSISAALRLALTLRYLATGESFRSLAFLFRVPQCTISTIIPEVLDAIYKVLAPEYLKVKTLNNSYNYIDNI